MGLFALVLHTHLPYLRKNGTYPCGEDFFHQAANECYLPLLDVFSRLADRGVAGALTLGVSPVLAGQMQDPYMLRELELYLGRVELRAWRQIANMPERFHPGARRAAVHARASRERLGALTRAGGIAGGFGALERAGLLQIMGGPAAHPLLSHAGSQAMVRAHVRAGMDEHERVFGRRPSAMWLPECAYAPERGIEQALDAFGVRAVIVDRHMLSGGPEPVGVGASGVAAFTIDRAVADVVWRNERGLPSSEWYLDFHHYDLDAGFRNWRVTDYTSGISGKEWYEPERAREQAAIDAHVFVARLEERFDALERTGALVVAAFDTELFGHWWHEGPLWLEHVLTLLAEHPRIETVTLDEALAVAPRRAKAELPAGTWGDGGDDRSWVSLDTSGMWSDLAFAERRVRSLAERPLAEAALRELLLLAASDWPYMVCTKQAAEYGSERFANHLARFGLISRAIEERDPNAERIAADLFEIDNAFPNLDAALAELRS